MKHLTLFNTEADYSSSELSLPNVSYIVESDVVKYAGDIPLEPYYIVIEDEWFWSDQTYLEPIEKTRDFINQMHSEYPESVNGSCRLYTCDFDDYSGSHKEGDFVISIYDRSLQETLITEYNIKSQYSEFKKYVTNVYITYNNVSKPACIFYFDEDNRIGFANSDVDVYINEEGSINEVTAAA